MKWNCEVEYRWANPNPVVPQICDTFIKAAQAQAIVKVDPATIELARTSCVNDIQTSLDVDVSICVCRGSEFCQLITNVSACFILINVIFFQNGRIAATTILQSGLEILLAGDDPDGVFQKVEQSVQDAVQEATLQADILLSNGIKICNENRCLESGSSTSSTIIRRILNFFSSHLSFLLTQKNKECHEKHKKNRIA